MLTHMTQAVGPLSCNCTLLFDDTTRDAIIVDPGGDAPVILDLVRKHRLNVKAVLHTHAHIDHVGASFEVAKETSAKTYLHPDDFQLYKMLSLQAQFIGIKEVQSTPMEPLVEGQHFAFGRYAARVMHTPGHSPGSVCFDMGAEHGLCLTGDTLFCGTVGRTDLWGGHAPTLKQSIIKRLLPLHGDTVIVPGHGAASTIDKERHHLARVWR